MRMRTFKADCLFFLFSCFFHLFLLFLSNVIAWAGWKVFSQTSARMQIVSFFYFSLNKYDSLWEICWSFWPIFVNRRCFLCFFKYFSRRHGDYLHLSWSHPHPKYGDLCKLTLPCPPLLLHHLPQRRNWISSTKTMRSQFMSASLLAIVLVSIIIISWSNSDLFLPRIHHGCIWCRWNDFCICS